MRIKIPDASEEENMQLWTYIYGELQQAGRRFRDEVPRHQFNWGKEAATRLRLAQKCKELASELRRYDTRAAETLMNARDGLLLDAETMTDRSQKTKRHSQHPENQHILLVMGRIHQCTGIFHDREVRELLIVVGMNLSLEALRQLRARIDAPPNKLRPR